MPALRTNPAVLRAVYAPQLLAAFNNRPGGSTTRIRRLLPLAEPPQAGDEVTDKRSINARRVLERRASDVARLYAEPADSDAIA
jgi:feruloyl-CoA synthase